ncbi:MAG TPA: long-chain fatty acid--CoA ligase [Dermatophilaceae bacterium]|nr:long-chain fatty acid--CoA ligase [Dermatophilaceae bacterium]
MSNTTLSAVGDEQVDRSLIEQRVPSVGHLFRRRVELTPHTEAFRFADGDRWVSMTWRQVADRAYHLAAGLVELGIEPEQRVALASGTRLEWALVDLAVMCAGAATTTIYPSTLAEDVAYIVADSGSRVVVAEDDAQVAKLREQRVKVPDVVAVVTIDGTPDGDWVLSLDQVEERGRKRLQREAGLVDARIDATGPDGLATLIYTSGTTGRPKGVRLLHSAWTYEGAAVDAIRILNDQDLQYLWLPLSHVFGKVLLVLPLQIGFATVIDGRVDKIVENVGVVRPTFMGAAPRIFEKAYARITGTVRSEGGIKARLFDWAVGVGGQVSDLRQEGRTPSPLLAAQHALADRLVLAKIRQRFGGRIKFFISGSAPLNRDVARWFDAVGLLILEGYGLTETSAASFVNRPGGYAIGSVGWPVPGTEVRVAEDGEILLRGPGVMAGYHDNPEATAEAFSDGWFHTGDVGEVDERGFLRITDRKKDLFKTSGGKYVAPSAIEAMFKGICPYASQLVVYGDGRNFVSALVTLDPEAMAGWAAEHGMAGKPYAEVVTSDAARQMVQGYIDELNDNLNRWETIKKFIVLDRDLTVEDGDLTPSMKLRRRVVTHKYQPDLDTLYS